MRQREKDRKPIRMPNHDCCGPTVYTVSDGKENVGGREAE